MQKIIAFLIAALAIVGAAYADSATDARLKAAIVGKWFSARHEYAYTATGFVYMGSPKDWQPGYFRDTWDVRDGIYYENGEPQRKISLSRKKWFLDGNLFLARYFLEEWARAWNEKIKRAERGGN